VDDVLGGEDSWKNVDSTEGMLLTSRLLMRGELTRERERGFVVDSCPKECGSNRAFYMQIQIRSADEPSTTFYKYVFFESLSLF